MTDLELATLEREIQDDTDATRIRLNSQYCPECGTRKIRGVCEVCQPEAAKQRQAENSAYYAAHIAPRTCPLCGDRIRPAADKMTGEWWMLGSRQQTWRCEGCTFVGTFQDFCDQHNRDTLPEHELVY